MSRKAVKYIFICFFVFIANYIFAISPDEIYESGIRAFKLERWRECTEILDRLIDVWPDYEKKSEAIYYRSIAAIRDLDKNVNDYRANLTNKIASDCEKIADELSDKDMSELNAAVAISKIDTETIDWNKLTKIKVDELKHYLLRGRHPNPQTEPLTTLKWVHAYEQNSSIKEPELKAMLELLKVKALWRFLLSPIAAEAEKKELEEIKVYPLTKAIEKALNNGFRQSQANMKKEFAIYGYHYDYLRSKLFGTEKVVSNSKWYKYLTERGLHNKELICPF